MRSPLFFYLSCLLIIANCFTFATIHHLKSRLDLVRDQAREAITLARQNGDAGTYWKEKHDWLLSQCTNVVVRHEVLYKESGGIVTTVRVTTNYFVPEETFTLKGKATTNFWTKENP